MRKSASKPDKFEVGRNLKAHHGSGPQPPDAALPVPAPKRWSFKRWMLSAALLVLALIIFIGSWDLVNVSRMGSDTFGSGNVLNLLSPGRLAGSSAGRVNILLIGYSVDDPGHPAATLTDSIMLMSLSTIGKNSYLLSIPRDLYVNIPGFGYAKINEAYKDGGVSLLEQVVINDFKVPINHYALVDYAAVRDTVNALGGITVKIQSSDPRGLYDPNISPVDGGPLKLSNGTHSLNGQTALNLTRARGDSPYAYGFPQADFDRTAHQQQVVQAIQSKLGWTLVLNPLKNGKIFSAIGHNVKTDIKFSEVQPLFSLLHRTNGGHLQTLSLRNFSGHNYLTDYRTRSGQDALIPLSGLSDYSDIDAAISAYNQQ